MPDLLVRLYDLPSVEFLRARLRKDGVEIRRALTPEKRTVKSWVELNFSERWADECEAAFSREPVSCFVALRGAQLLGFACYDVTCRNFFGPLGVAEESRGHGIGAALSLVSLDAIAQLGYAYAILGDVGPIDFFKKLVGSTVIENSDPGIYRGLL